MSKARLVITAAILEGLDIRVIHAATGEPFRHLTRDYQPTGKPKGPTRPT